jgi:glycosyltransferase involved in cell wall biosynthesis
MIPIVSICIPTFEQPNAFRRALESTLQQNYPVLDIVISDDSRDDSIAKAAAEFSGDSRISYLKNSVPKGSPGNWNEAIRHAKGDFIKILHHDDWFTRSDSISRFAQMLIDRPDSDLAFSATSVCDPSGKQKWLHAPGVSELRSIRRNPRVLIWTNSIGGPSSVIFRRSAFHPFDGRLQWLVDVEFYISLLEENRSFAYFPEPLVATTDGSVRQVTYSTATKEVRIREFLALYKKWKPTVGWPEVRSFLELLKRADPRMVRKVLGDHFDQLPSALRWAAGFHALRHQARTIRKRAFFGKG